MKGSVMKGKVDFLFKSVPDDIKGKLQFDLESLYSTTDEITADNIVKDIKCNIKVTHNLIVDATACIGGSAYALSKVFDKVIAIENNEKRFQMLKTNIELLQVSDKVLPIFGDCLEVYKSLEPADAIFIDPPWGGPQYIEHKKIRLKISDLDLNEVCELFAKTSKIKYIILKLPVNFDYTSLKSSLFKVSFKNKMLRKMHLLILEVLQ